MKTTLFLAPFALWSSAVLAQHSDWTHLYSQLQINDVVEQPTCFWIASDRGVFRLDKANDQVTHYNKTNSLLPDDHVQTITADADGAIWIGTYDLALLEVPADGSPWQAVPYPDAAVVYSSEADAAGNIWLGTSAGLWQYDGMGWQQHAISGTDLCNDGPVWELKINSQGTVYAASHSLLRFDDGTWTELRDTGTTMSAYNDAYVCLENDTTVWYFGDAAPASRYDGQTWAHWQQSAWNGSPALPAVPNFPYLSVQRATDGRVYYNSHHSLVYFDGNDWTEVQPIEQPNLGIQTFRRSDDGSIWLFGRNEWAKEQNGTSSSGQLHTLHPFGLFCHFANDRNGNLYLSDYSRGIYAVSTGTWQRDWVIINNDTIAIHENLVFDDANEKWFISRINTHPVLIEQQGNAWQVHDAGSTGLFPTSNGPSDYHYFYYLAANTAGTIWVVDESSTIFQYKNQQWSALSIINAPLFSDIASDAQGNFWWVEGTFGGSYQLRRHDGNQVQDFPIPGNAPIMLFRPAIDAAGTVWISTTNGLLQAFDGTNWTSLALPTNVQADALLARGTSLMVATSNSGLWQYENGQWTNARKSNSGLSSDEVRKMAWDVEGDLWCMTGNSGQVLDIWDLNVSTNTQTPIPTSIEPTWNIFPNPASTQIAVDKSLMGTERVQVLNALGQPVLSLPARAADRLTLDVSSLASGVYWLQIDRETKAFLVK